MRAKDSPTSANESRAEDSSSACSLPRTRTSVASVAEPAFAVAVTLPEASAGAVTTPLAAPVQLTSPAATGVSWSSTALTRSVRRKPGNTRGSSGVTISSSTTPLPGVTNTPTPFGSWRSKPSDGELRTVTAFSPSARATIVVEPPPSRFSAVSAPSATNVRASWRSVTPSTGAWRPSAVTSSIVLPPSLKPIAVRGWTALSSWPSGSAAPSRDERLVAADRELHLLRDRVLEAVRERGVVAGSQRADRVRGAVTADEHEAVRRDLPRAGAGRVDGDDLVLDDEHLGDVGHAEQPAVTGVRPPGAGEREQRARGHAVAVGGVERQHRVRGALQRRAGLERQVDEPADAVLADARVVPARAEIRRLEQRPAEDLPAERRGRVVDVEEVRVDAGDRARLVRGLGQRAAGRDRALPQRVRFDRRIRRGPRRGSDGRTSRSSRPSSSGAA